MPRIRSIKPDFYSDPDLGRLSLEARYLYPALWVVADDKGRLAGDPRLIKSQAFPFDDKITVRKVEALISELEASGKVQRYSVDGLLYLFLPNFENHQRIDKPQPARFPDPAESDPDPSVEESKNVPGMVPELSHPDRKGGEGNKSMVPTGPASPNPAALGKPLSNGTSQEQKLARRHLEALKPIVSNGGAFDLLHEFKSIWPLAWQEAVDSGLNPKSVGINLLGNFIASVTDSEPEWGRAGQLVGKYGKLALLGIDEGIIANADDPYRYAFRVCQNQSVEHRAEAGA